MQSTGTTVSNNNNNQQDLRYSADVEWLLESVQMEELGQRVGKIWRACDSPSWKNSTSDCSDLFKPGQNFSYLFPPVCTCSHPVHTCSHLFPPVHNCSHLFTPVHTCSHLFTTVHTSVTIYALRAMAVSR